MTDADKLLAVCRAVWPAKKWMIYTAAYSWVQEAGDCFTTGYGGTKFLPTSTDDLARVVAMLTPGQRARFELALNHQIRDDGRPHDPVSAYEAITAPASVWLAALAAATGVE